MLKITKSGDERGDFYAWLGILGPPTLWLINFQIIYARVMPACASGTKIGLLISSIVFLALIVGCVGWYFFMRPQKYPGYQAPGPGMGNAGGFRPQPGMNIDPGRMPAGGVPQAAPPGACGAGPGQVLPPDAALGPRHGRQAGGAGPDHPGAGRAPLGPGRDPGRRGPRPGGGPGAALVSGFAGGPG